MRINFKIKNELKNSLIDKIQKEKELVTVLSADFLEIRQKEALQKKFPDFNWKEVVYEIDKSVIAGVIIKVGSRTIDLSLSGTLSKLSNTLYEID